MVHDASPQGLNRVSPVLKCTLLFPPFLKCAKSHRCLPVTQTGHYVISVNMLLIIFCSVITMMNFLNKKVYLSTIFEGVNKQSVKNGLK